MNRLELLKSISLGAQIAEDEVQELANYFVETHQWDQISRGKIDIIRGEKGAGKSAIYSLLSTKSEDFFKKGILLVAAENPRGTTVFRDIITDPPASEREFVWLWKVYILTIIAQKFREHDIKSNEALRLYSLLEDAQLLSREHDLRSVLRAAMHFVRHRLKIRIEPKMEFDEESGAPSLSFGKLMLEEPSFDLKKMGFDSVDALLTYANAALEQHNYNIWVLLDRLDVAFQETHDLEANALRALLRVYSDLRSFSRISLKIFLREDIWKRIFEGGFREASHINDYTILEWTTEGLLNLAVKRFLSNHSILDKFNVDPREILEDSKQQDAFFYRLFPDQVEQGPKSPHTFKWMVSRCADASGKTAPRELIHLLKSLQETEIKRLENGGRASKDDQLFDRSAFKPALLPVSIARLHQYLYAEYAHQKEYLSKLEHQKSEQTLATLADLWGMTDEQAEKKAEELREIGFFERRIKKGNTSYWVPFLYRDALNMVQGMADSVS